MKDNPKYDDTIRDLCCVGEVEATSQGALFMLMQHYISSCITQEGRQFSTQLERLNYEDYAGVHTLASRYVKALKKYIDLTHIPAISAQPVEALSKEIVQHGMQVLDSCVEQTTTLEHAQLAIALSRLSRSLTEADSR